MRMPETKACAQISKPTVPAAGPSMVFHHVNEGEVRNAMGMRTAGLFAGFETAQSQSSFGETIDHKSSPVLSRQLAGEAA
jgi:hypothetical protein